MGAAIRAFKGNPDARISGGLFRAGDRIFGSYFDARYSPCDRRSGCLARCWHPIRKAQRLPCAQLASPARSGSGECPIPRPFADERVETELVGARANKRPRVRRDALGCWAPYHLATLAVTHPCALHEREQSGGAPDLFVTVAHGSQGRRRGQGHSEAGLLEEPPAGPLGLEAGRGGDGGGGRVKPGDEEQQSRP